jgi:hypothetical protein
MPGSSENQEVEDRGESDRTFARVSLLYQENARLAAAFWDWQHKTLTLFTAGIGALLAIEAWVFDRHFGRYLAIPLVSASLLSAMCARFAQRNREILNKAYDIGAGLEREIAKGLKLSVGPTFTWLRDSRSTYRRILPPVFWVVAGIFLILAIAAAVHPPKKAPNPTAAMPATSLTKH